MESLLFGAPCSMEGCSTSIERSVIFGLARTNPRFEFFETGGWSFKYRFLAQMPTRSPNPADL
jgi:hypothetical protein